jgi:hypothetical protein
MAEWGIEKVVEIITESIKDGTVDATDTENLIRIAYSYVYIDGKHKEDTKNLE